MKKKIIRDSVYYDIAWSPLYTYDKYDAMKRLPELAGILAFFEKGPAGVESLLFYTCWRDGLRVGMRRLIDPAYTPQKEITEKLNSYNLSYRYTVVDSSPGDMSDILAWLIGGYKPLLNSPDYNGSGRYDKFFVRETELKPDQVVEKFSI
jgi:hypothetical protein